MAEQRPRATVRGGRRDGGHRQAADPHRALRPHGGQERDLALKQFDPVNRDLEIRDLYNLEDAFHLSKEYGGAYRARLQRQPRVLRSPRWQDRLAARPGWRPPPDRAAARRLPGGRRVAALRRRQLHGDRAGDARRAPLRNVRRPLAERRRDGHVLHADDQRRQRTAHPRRRRPADEAGRGRLPLPGGAHSRAVSGRRERLDPGSGGIMTAKQATMTAPATATLELDDIQAGALMPRPTPYAGTYQIVRIDDRHAGRELLRRLIPYLDSAASFNPHDAGGARGGTQLPGTQGPRGAGGLAGQLRARVPAGHGRPRGPPGGRGGERSRALGETARVRRTSISWWSASRSPMTT